MIKVFVSQNPTQEPVASVFTFTSSNAREDCDSIQESLKIAMTERNKPKTVADILKEGEDGLLRDTDLQIGLLKQDTELSEMFRALVIEGQLAPEQFWRARVVNRVYGFNNSICCVLMRLNGYNKKVLIMSLPSLNRKLKMERLK
jgi:hypothetical protein